MTYNLDANDHELTIAARTLGIKVVDNAKVKRAEGGQLDKWWGIPNPYGGPGVWVWVEYKTEAGTLRPSQYRELAECDEMSLPAEVVRNTADVERVYKKYLSRFKDDAFGPPVARLVVNV